LLVVGGLIHNQKLRSGSKKIEISVKGSILTVMGVPAMWGIGEV
jgi:hypothetical protein